MSNVVRSSFQAASQELIAKLVKAGYLPPALRHEARAITAAIARLKQEPTRARQRLERLGFLANGSDHEPGRVKLLCSSEY